MPLRLRPTAPVAADAILVGDPGRALLLAQELLEQPKMSNHARGLWGYSGQTANGANLTVQSTGMGGPSAAAVLGDLVELGVRRAVRIGTSVAAGGGAQLGELLLVVEALASEGSAAAFGVAAGAALGPDPILLERLRGELGANAREGRVVSLDAMPADATLIPPGAAASDLQTVALMACGRTLGIEVAAMLIVSEAAGEALEGEALEEPVKRAGRAASAVLSNPKVEG